MKQIFTLFISFISFVFSFGQSGTTYRWVGAGSTSTVNGITGYTVSSATGTNNSNILKAANWNIVNKVTGALTAADSSPSSGATLQFFGKGINISTDLDLSAYVFHIQIRSEYNSTATSTASMDLGFIAVHGGTNNSNTLDLGAGSTITLGWGLTTVLGVEKWTPGYLILYRASRSSDIQIGGTSVAAIATGTTNNKAYYLNANGYAATSAANATSSNGTLAPTSTNAANLIRNTANGPKANLSVQATARPGGAIFAQFAYFYNPSAASSATVAPLPLQLKEFSAQKEAGKVTLNWSTVLEINTSHFEVEQSANASSWKTIARVNAAGNSGSLINYSAADYISYTADKVYYRLKMVDADGKSQYSPVAVVNFETSKAKLTAYPNPATSYTMISSAKAINENVTVSVFNSNGMMMKKELISKPGNSFRVGLENLAPGAYILKIVSGTDLIEIVKIQKN